MGRDIRTALNKALQRRGRAVPPSRPDQMPRLFDGVYGLGSRDFRPEHIDRRLRVRHRQRAAQGRQARRGRGVVHGARRRPSLRGEVRRHAVAAARRRDRRPLPLDRRLGRHHHRARTSAPSSATSTTSSTNATRSWTSSAIPKRSSTSAPIRSTGPRRRARRPPTSWSRRRERIRVNCDLRHVNVVLCCDPKAFTHTQPARRDGRGRLLSSGSPRKRASRPGSGCRCWARKQIIDKKIRVFTLPGFQIARKATDRGRPAAAHAGQRLPGRVLRRLAAARGIPHHARSSSARSSTSST